MNVYIIFLFLSTLYRNQWTNAMVQSVDINITEFKPQNRTPMELYRVLRAHFCLKALTIFILCRGYTFTGRFHCDHKVVHLSLCTSCHVIVLWKFKRIPTVIKDTLRYCKISGEICCFTIITYHLKHSFWNYGKPCWPASIKTSVPMYLHTMDM